MKKRLCIISEHASPLAPIGNVDSGGQNIYVANVARRLAAKGNLVDVFTRRDDENCAPVVEWEDGVRVIHVPAGPASYVKKENLFSHMEEFAENMIDFIRMNRLLYDVVHANFWMSGLVAACVKSALQIPYAITFHALGKIRRMHQKEADEFPQVREQIEQQVAGAADAVIAECPQDEDDLIRLYRVAPRKIAQISCGVDPSEFEPISKGFARVLLGFSPHEKIILQLGRIVPRKGIDTVIESVAYLRDHHGRDVKLLVVGGELVGDSADAAEIRRLRSIAADRGVLDRVLFCGRADRDKLKYYYSAADAFVTVPWYEPFGITPLEAMACGTPVIGSEVGGIKFTVNHGSTGLLVPPKCPESVAEALEALYKEPELIGKFGRAGIERVNKLFTWDRITNALDNLFSEIVEQNLNLADALRRPVLHVAS